MDGAIEIVLLGWDDRARCLLDTCQHFKDKTELLAIVSDPEAKPPPADIGLKILSMKDAMDRLRGSSLLIDLRKDVQERPPEIPLQSTWLPFQVSSLLLDLCERTQYLQHYRGVVETARDAIVTIDETHRILFFNRAAEEMFGYRKDEVIGQDLSIIIPHPHKERHREYVERYIRTRRGRFINHTVELTAERRNGDEFPIHISFSVAEEGPHLLMTGMIRDITEMKDLERKVVQNERLASMGEALSYITHEIKNPLLVIGGFARNLQSGENLDDEQRKRLEIIVSEVQRLEGLLAQIQDFTKPLLLEKERIDLAQFTEDILPMFQDLVKERGIRLPLEIEARPVVPADPDRLRQVIINLLKNALEAIEREGTVKVRIKKGPHSAILEIEDNGVGIPHEKLKDIFEPFVTTKKEGTGLGLPLCRKIVNDHGGEIRIWSTPGKGTRVRVELPLEFADPAGM